MNQEQIIELYCPTCGSLIIIEGKKIELELSHVSMSKKQANELGIKNEKVVGIEADLDLISYEEKGYCPFDYEGKKEKEKIINEYKKKHGICIGCGSPRCQNHSEYSHLPPPNDGEQVTKAG